MLLSVEKQKVNINPKEIPSLQPFINTVRRNHIQRFDLLHVSQSCKSYLIKFEPGFRDFGEAIVLKVYREQERSDCHREIQNLQRCAENLMHCGWIGVYIPQLVWFDQVNGLLATRWIPGQDLDQAIKKSSRIWSLHSPERDVKSVTQLLHWLQVFAASESNSVSVEQAHNHDRATWECWLDWLSRAFYFNAAWRENCLTALRKLMMGFEGSGWNLSLFHGDFTPWNIRRDFEGNHWVMDWRRLEAGHWLEAAYRFYYALCISGLSPLAKPGYYEKIFRHLETYALNQEPELELHVYYKTRAIIRNLFYMCHRPPDTLKRKWLQTFLIRELGLTLGLSSQ